MPGLVSSVAIVRVDINSIFVEVELTRDLVSFSARLENLFGGGGGKAEASHILIKGSNADAKCAELKASIEKAGTSRDKLETAFARAANANSACPSASKGGALGSFGRGQMVAQFDKVVFNDAVGVVHGPVKTQFGSHLILITDRDEK